MPSPPTAPTAQPTRTTSAALPQRAAAALPVGKPFAGILARSRGRGQAGWASPAGGLPPSLGKGAPLAPTTTHGEAERGRVDAEKGSSGGGRDGEAEGERAPYDDAHDLQLLDPAARHAASLAPPLTTPTSPSAATATEAPLRARSLEELLPALVRRIAWAGDKHKGTVSLELGAGSYAGTTVVVHADGGRVRVEISGREGPELDRLRARLDGRLRSHGLDVESVT